jgi:hypothetical protein
MTAGEIHCVVVGYNGPELADLLAKAERSKNYSGGYQHLLANSASFRGKRLGYAQLFNAALEETTGRKQGLHAGKLPNRGACYLVSFLRRRAFAIGGFRYWQCSAVRAFR